jgi:hypothetical protein
VYGEFSSPGTLGNNLARFASSSALSSALFTFALFFGP